MVEYPLPLLEKGVEIVDSPGLNDTEARNQLTLEYVNNCHAILFVLSATQQFTLGEQRYLDNYIKDRGLTVFFLINAWDEIQNRLVNPEDETELQEAEERVRQVFRTNLEPYCLLDGEDMFADRTFEISSLQALRQRLKRGGWHPGRHRLWRIYAVPDPFFGPGTGPLPNCVRPKFWPAKPTAPPTRLSSGAFPC